MKMTWPWNKKPNTEELIASISNNISGEEINTVSISLEDTLCSLKKLSEKFRRAKDEYIGRDDISEIISFLVDWGAHAFSTSADTQEEKVRAVLISLENIETEFAAQLLPLFPASALPSNLADFKEALITAVEEKQSKGEELKEQYRAKLFELRTGIDEAVRSYPELRGKLIKPLF